MRPLTRNELSKSLALVDVVPGRPHAARHELATLLRDATRVTRRCTVRQLRSVGKDVIEKLKFVLMQRSFETSGPIPQTDTNLIAHPTKAYYTEVQTVPTASTKL